MRRKRRWRSRSVKKSSKKKVFFLVLIIFTLITVQSFIFIEKNLRPPLMNVAKVRIKQIATQSINASLTEQISKGTNLDKLIEWKYDHTGKITGFMLNYTEHMRIAAETRNIVQKTLDDLQRMPESIPLGQALDSAIIASFGPEIPIKFVPAGSVLIDLTTRKQDAGINMILVEVYIHIIAEVTIIIPFDTEAEIVETEVPITYLLVVGDVPAYYFDSNGKPIDSLNGMNPIPPISIPQFNSADTEDNTEN
ncbi:sporulation protein YunB [Chengkuizengella sp. SCS-71B]|uniref:sporulation protein YunB n=1 Tax=Chengkuizengella sp. SCS-71B TaxID=3115290 RepID=UPI0032C229FC